MSLLAFSVVYEELEDDGLRPAFSPIAIQKKFQPIMGKNGNELTSKVFPVIPSIPVASSTKTETAHPRKRKRKDRFDEPLQEFLARRKKAKKEKKTAARGFQHMITDYFKHSKPVVKVEKKDKPSTSRASTSTTDILESEQYKFDPTSVPQDDDIEIIEEIPARDTDVRKSTPFVYVIPETQMDPIKEEEETKPDVPEEDDAMDGIGKSSPVNNEDNNEAVTPDTQPMDLTSDAISLENEVVEESEKPTEKETMLMQQVQELSKGLEEMKALINRKKTIQSTAKVASQLKKKILRQRRRKTTQHKPIFDKPIETPKLPEPEPSLDKPNNTPELATEKKSDDDVESEKSGFLQPQPEPSLDKPSDTPQLATEKKSDDDIESEKGGFLQPQPEPSLDKPSDTPQLATEKKSDDDVESEKGGFLQPEPEPSLDKPSDTLKLATDNGSNMTGKKDEDLLQPEAEPLTVPPTATEKKSDNDETADLEAQPDERSATTNDHLYTKAEPEKTDSQELFSTCANEDFTHEDEITDSQLIESTKYMTLHDTVHSTLVIAPAAEVVVSSELSQGTQCTASKALAFLENTEQLPSEDFQPCEESEVDPMTTRSENDLLGEESVMSDVDDEVAAKLLGEGAQTAVTNKDENSSSGDSADYDQEVFNDDYYGDEDNEQNFPPDDDDANPPI